MGSVMPVCSPAWGDRLPRGQVSGTGTHAGWGGFQQRPYGCSAVGGGSADSRWAWDLGSLSRSLERGLMGAVGLKGLVSWRCRAPRAMGAWQAGKAPLRLWGWDCPSGLSAASPGEQGQGSRAGDAGLRKACARTLGALIGLNGTDQPHQGSPPTASADNPGAPSQLSSGHPVLP